MFDHVSLNVRDYPTSRAFYESALAPLGWTVAKEWPEHGVAAFGPDGRPMFFIEQREPFSTGTHVAFICDDRPTVDAFHAAALAAGGTDNGRARHTLVSRELLRGLRARSGRKQHRGGLPWHGMS